MDGGQLDLSGCDCEKHPVHLFHPAAQQIPAVHGGEVSASPAVLDILFRNVDGAIAITTHRGANWFPSLLV